MKKILIGITLSLILATIYAVNFPPFFLGFIDGMTFATFIALISGTYLYLERKGVFNGISYSFTRISDGLSRNRDGEISSYRDYIVEKNKRLSNTKSPLFYVALFDLIIVVILLIFYYM